VIVINGRVVEQSPSREVNRNPWDWYTRLVLDAIPNPFEQAI
jgi:peptide/nickel transport system ATP-binding protein